MVAPVVVAAILTAIRAGVPAAKIIAKYGKKAYEITKKAKNDKKAYAGVTAAFVASSVTPTKKDKKDKKVDKPLKKYKGGLVVKPKLAKRGY